MSAPTFVIDPSLATALVGDTVTLAGAEGHHAVTVQRLRVGEQVDLVDGHGTRLIGAITKIEAKDSCEVLVDEVVIEPAPQPTVTAVQAIPKGDRGELAVQMLTEGGVDVLVPWQAENCVAKWDEGKAAKNHTKWQATARESSKQARRARFPIVEPIVTTAAVADLVANAGVALVLDEASQIPLTSIDISSVHDVVLVIGPEGGLSDNERAVFADSGADLVRLGSSVLRTSTAGIAALGVVMARVGRW